MQSENFQSHYNPQPPTKTTPITVQPTPKPTTLPEPVKPTVPVQPTPVPAKTRKQST